MLHETCMFVRIETCVKHASWNVLFFACNMHVTCATFRVGMSLYMSVLKWACSWYSKYGYGVCVEVLGGHVLYMSLLEWACSELFKYGYVLGLGGHVL